jgi:uncharacterized protein YraI
MDITMPEGTELRAIAGGTVYMIRNPGRPGYIEVRVRTADRHEHLYNHMSRSVVAEGADVTAGQLLGYSGTNNSPHLHFELRIPNTDCDRGVAIVDPESLLRQSVAVDWKAGDRFQVTAELNLRAAAGTGSAVVALLPAGTTGTITGGPSSADGYTWWQVETSLGSGWVSQHRLDKRQDSVWMPGDQFTVTETLRLRAEAGTSSAIIATLPAGTTGEIAGGPGTADGYTWWQVQTGLGNGWVAQDWLGRT